MQSGSSSRSGRNRASSSSSGRNRGAAVEADVIGRRAAAEAGAIGEQQLDARRRQTGSSSGSGCRNRAREQQLKRTQSGRSKADAIGEKQLFRELSGAGLRTVGEQGERAKRAQLLVYVIFCEDGLVM